MKNTAKRVLVVDDSPAMRELITETVKTLGYGVSAVGDGMKAMNALQNGAEVDAIITDFQMPFMDGVALTRWVKRNRPDVQVIFTSANSLEDFKEVAEAAGADEVLSKSEIVAKLPAILDSLIGAPNPLGLM